MRKSFKKRKNVLEMFDNEHLIKWLDFLSYSKRAKNIYITKQHHNRLQSRVSIMRATLHDE